MVPVVANYKVLVLVIEQKTRLACAFQMNDKQATTASVVDLNTAWCAALKRPGIADLRSITVGTSGRSG